MPNTTYHFCLLDVCVWVPMHKELKNEISTTLPNHKLQISIKNKIHQKGKRPNKELKINMVKKPFKEVYINSTVKIHYYAIWLQFQPIITLYMILLTRDKHINSQNVTISSNWVYENVPKSIVFISKWTRFSGKVFVYQIIESNKETKHVCNLRKGQTIDIVIPSAHVHINICFS